MPPIPSIRTTVLFILALILVQGAAALSIEQAPLNPAFIAYQEGQDSGAAAVASSCSTNPSNCTTPAAYVTGLVPSPAVVVWPDGYHAAAANETSLPARFDLRDEGRVTPVRYQGWCGSCWAFATLASLESTYLTDTSEAENFSESNMNNLCSNEYPDGFDVAPCDGGNYFMSSAYLTRGSGPVREADDPYLLLVPSNRSPTDLSPVLDVREITYLPPRTGPLDNSLFQQTIMDEGAFGVSFIINWSCFADNETTYYWPGEAYVNDGAHAITLVGWDDTFPKESFAVTPPGDGAFILKNSWGTTSGENGYTYISYYDPRVGYFWDNEQTILETKNGNPIPGALFTGVPADPDSQTYQYDPLGWTTAIGDGDDTTFYGANVFTADRYEALTDVSFYTREPGTEYTVAIFTNFTTPPGDAAPVAWMSGTAALPGYHTVCLTETVPLMPGEIFSVVIEVTSPTDTYPLVVEMPIEGYSSRATAEAGESFVSVDGDAWEDLTTSSPDTNVCIKAHTHTYTVVPQDYPTIMEAVNAAASGDTIIVEAGTYPEELEIEKALTLLGVGTPVVAPPEHGIGAKIQADNVTMAGFSFEGNREAFGGVGIMRNNCTLYDIDISEFTDGLHIEDVRGLSLSAVALEGNTNNLEFTDPVEDAGNSIDETVTVNGRPVIYREDISGETIDASSNAGAIICVNCSDLTIRDTTTGDIADGITLSSCRDVIMENITADGITNGIRAEFSENVAVRSSSFGPECMCGINIMGNNGFFAEDNEIICLDSENMNSGQGVALFLAENVTIADNIITSGTDGIGVLGLILLNTSVSDNTFIGESDWGIAAMIVENMEISGNTMNTTSFGIMIDSGYGVSVSDNSIQGNDTGFGLGIVADGAEITHNTAANCQVPTLMILNDSVIRENHFTGNEFPTIDVVEDGTDVYVYRNDFLLTLDEDADAQMTSAACAASAIMTDPCVDDWWTMPETPSVPDRWADACREGVVEDVSHEHAFMSTADGHGVWCAAAEITPQQATVGHVGWDTAVWHSPTEETYWYRGQPYTRTPGNYWNLYNGTDTIGDGIGDTPYLYLNYTIDSYPLVKPFAWYLDENPDTGGDDPSDDIATAGAMQAGDSATFSFTGTAVEKIAITAADGTGRVVLTVDSAGSGPDGLSGTIYQYLSAELTGMTDADVRDAVISFRVPAAWLRAEGLAPADIALFRYHDGNWQELPTSVVREEGGWVHFEGTTPGFSTFAIAEGSGEAMPVPQTDATVDITVTETAATPEATAAPAEPPVTVAVVGEEAPAATAAAATPQESPVGLLPLIGAGAALCVFLRRH